MIFVVFVISLFWLNLATTHWKIFKIKYINFILQRILEQRDDFTFTKRFFHQNDEKLDKNLMYIPNEIWSMIFDNLNSNEMNNVRLLCSHFNELFVTWLQTNEYVFGEIINDEDETTIGFVPEFVDHIKHVKVTKIDNNSIQLFSHCESIIIGRCNLSLDGINLDNCKLFEINGSLETYRKQYPFEELRRNYDPDFDCHDFPKLEKLTLYHHDWLVSPLLLLLVQHTKIRELRLVNFLPLSSNTLEAYKKIYINVKSINDNKYKYSRYGYMYCGSAAQKGTIG